MKVAFIASDDNVSSGAFLSMTNLAIQLRRLGVESIVILPKEGPYVGPHDGRNLLKENHIKYYVVPSISWIISQDFRSTPLTNLGQVKNILLNKRTARGLANLLKKEHVDIVHLNTSYTYYAAYAAKYAKLPFVWHIREFLEEDHKNRFCFPRYAHWLMNQADLVIAISKSIYRKYHRDIKPGRMKVIYNGIDTETFYRPGREIFTEDVLRLCYVGGLSEVKGTDDLLEAFRLLNAESCGSKYRLVIAGRGDVEYENSVMDRIQRYDLKNVSYIGYQKDTAAVMSDADVAVITSRCEAFGRVTVEAMLTGALVLGADSAGTKELLSGGRFGVLYRCGDADDMKEKIKYIMSHRQELRNTAADASEFMAHHMTAEINARRIYREYQRLTGK